MTHRPIGLAVKIGAALLASPNADKTDSDCLYALEITGLSQVDVDNALALSGDWSERTNLLLALISTKSTPKPTESIELPSLD
jgi:hypothetical protein